MSARGRALAVVVVVIILGLFGWIGYAVYHEINEPTSGTVTKLEYEPAVTTVTCTQSGKVTVCTPHTTPECYRVEYDNGSDWGDACVAPNVFPLYRKGDHYPKEM